jgi:hypothetical protein
MAKEISTQVIINAPVAEVWQAFYNFENYKNWNPFIKQINGSPQVGSTILIHLQTSPTSTMQFKPKVLVNNANSHFRWIGKLLFKGLFDGEHYFKCVPNTNGTTTFIQGEIFKGILVPFLSKMINIDTKNNFELMNQKLKLLVEQNLK